MLRALRHGVMVVMVGAVVLGAPPVHAAGAWKAALREAGGLYQKGEWARAADAYARVAVMVEQEEGPDSVALADVLEVQALTLHALKRFDEKTPVLERVLRIRMKKLGADHPTVLLAQYNVAENVMSVGRERDRGADLLVTTVTRYVGRKDRDPAVVQGMLGYAEQLAAEGPADMAGARLRNMVAELGTAGGWPPEQLLPRQIAAAQALQGQGALAAAEKWWTAAVNTAGAGVDVGVLNACAEVRRQLGRYDDAWPLYARALEKLDRHNPAQAGAVGTVLHNQGLTRLQQGRWDEAEKLLQASLEVQQAVAGPEGMDLSYALNDLGELRRHQGRFDEAQAFYERALAIREKHTGRGSVLWGTVRQNMGLLAQERGELPTAVGMLVEADGAYAALPAGDLRRLTLTLNLGVLRRELGAPWDALAALHGLRDQLGRWLDGAHPLMASVHEQVALTDRVLMRPRAALESFRAAHAVRERALQAGHPDRARSLVNLAVAAEEAGETAEADALLERADRDVKAAVPADHPLMGVVAHTRGLRALARGEVREAETRFRTALDIRRTRLGPHHPHTLESLEAQALAQLLAGSRNDAMTLLAGLADARETQRQRTLVARSDADLINVSTDMAWEVTRLASMQLARLDGDAAAARLVLTELLRTRGRGLDVYVATRDALRVRGNEGDRAAMRREAELRAALAAADAQGDDARAAEVMAQLDALQRTLSHRAGVLDQGGPVTAEAVASALPRGAVLVEFHQAMDLDDSGNGRGLPFYVAYVLDSAGAVHARRLGDVAAVDAAVAALRDAAMTPQGDTGAAARALHGLVWQPLVDVLPGPGAGASVFVAPMGELLVAPLGLMTDSAGARVMDGVELVYLSSGRDLLRTPTERPDGDPALLLANPDYGPAPADSPGQETRGTARGLRALREISFEPLPATAAEAKGVQKALGRATLLTGSKATRDALLRTRAPRVLHLATHGFFLPSLEDLRGPRPGARGLKMRKGPPPADASPTSPEGRQVLLSPLTSSGVALAGANRAEAGGHSGVVTAAEVATLDLRGTQLVVLSACQTGMGERLGGEGVLGLRRALVQAGAQTQLLSLWNVDDDATAELMRTYYAGLTRGLGRSAALRAAQQHMQKGRWSHPYYWAAFVVSGDWRPLRPR